MFPSILRPRQRGRNQFKSILLREKTRDRLLRHEPLEDRRLLSATGQEQAIELFTTSPALFVENQGQWADESVRFLHEGDGVNVAMTDRGVIFQLYQFEGDGDAPDLVDPLAEPEEVVTSHTQFTLAFDGAGNVAPVGLDQADTTFNYHLGDEANWQTDVSTYETVVYPDLYNGIDLLTWGRRDSLKYEFHVAPGADYGEISLSFDGIDGLSIDDDGALHVATELGDLIDTAPFIYQEIEGEQVEVTGSFQLIDADTYSFSVSGDYDPTVELIIDPILDWSTYLGGGGGDNGFGVAVDTSGSVLVTGSTYSSGWASGGFDTSYNGIEDVFVAKLYSAGAHLWSTYLGGEDLDVGSGVAVDPSGNVLVTGSTGSGGWASGGFDTSHNGITDAFVAKLSSAGAHLWSTYLGGGEL